MKKVKTFQFFLAAALCIFCCAAPLRAAENNAIATVNFKKIVEISKLGKHEQETLEAMQKQMGAVLGEKEKKLSEYANKLQDEDYLDSISAETETEMKREFRAMSQEFSQIQNQYYQTLQQANFKIIQKINQMITNASEVIAKKEKFNLIINDEAAFFASPELDISKQVVEAMDEIWEKEKENAEDNKEKSND